MTATEINNLLDSSIELVKRYGNGYPNFTGMRAITDIDTYEEAEEIAALIPNARIEIIHHKGGWNLRESHGQVDSPFTIDDYLSKLGDNYCIVDQSYIDAEKDEIEEWQALPTRLIDLIDALEAAKEDQIVIAENGYYLGTFDTKPFMSYAYDTHYYEICVVFDPRDIVEED